jgi:hypothetical protein
LRTDSVEDHDGVVQRITDHRQHRRQYCQVKGDLEQREDPKHQDHVVEQRQHSAQAELPLKAERDINQNAAQGEQHA